MGVGRFLYDLWTVCWRELRRLSRSPEMIIMSIIQPVIWLVILGNLFEKVAASPGFPTDSYLQYMAPGVVVMTIVFGGLFGGIGLLFDRQLGFLDKLLVSPISRPALVTGRMMALAIQLIIQCIVILILALLMGVDCASGILGLMLILLIALGLAFVVGGFSLSLGIRVRSHEPFMAITQLLAMPLLMTSDMLMPRDMMPDWLQTIATFNPVTYAIEPIRILMNEGWEISGILPGVGVIFGLAIVSVLLTTWVFQKQQSL